MIKVIIEIAGQQMRFAASNFQMEGKDIYISIDEKGVTEPAEVSPPPTKSTGS
jgi:hypothetical protein